MSPPAAIRRATLLMLLLPFIVYAGSTCERTRPGLSTIKFRILAAGGHGGTGLAIDHRRRSVAPDEVVKDITIRDEDGTTVVHLTVHGRDIERWRVGVDGRRCLTIVGKTIEVPGGVEYEILADDDPFFVTSHDWDEAYSQHDDLVTVEILGRGVPDPDLSAEGNTQPKG